MIASTGTKKDKGESNFPKRPLQTKSIQQTSQHLKSASLGRNCCSPLLKKTTTHLGQLRKSTGEFSRSAQGTPKLTIKKQTRPFRSTVHSVYHNRIVFTLLITLSTAIFITTGVYSDNHKLKHVT